MDIRVMQFAHRFIPAFCNLERNLESRSFFVYRLSTSPLFTKFHCCGKSKIKEVLFSYTFFKKYKKPNPQEMWNMGSIGISK